MPVFVCYCHLLYDLLNILISSLHGAIHLWPVRRRVMVFYFELRAEFSDHLVVLPERAGFSYVYLIRSILEINKVV